MFRASFVPALILGVCACQQDFRNGETGPYEVGFYVGGVNTRTEMMPNGLSAEWSAGDELAVWARNSAGEFTLANQRFYTYGLDISRGFFTTELAEPMPEDVYTYYCTYPVPVAVNGTEVTFNLPAHQDGKASGGADIMVATPVKHGPMVQIPEIEDHSGMKMQVNRMMHQFRFYIPSDNTVIGDEKLQQIMLTFPSGVAGKVMLDFADPTVAPQLSEPVSSMKLVLDEPLAISGDEPQYACLAIAPKQFAEGDALQVKAYTEDKIAYFDPIDLRARDFQPGHSTPVRLNVREIVDFAGILTFTVAVNNLGEDPNVITLTAPEGCNFGDGGTNVYRYEPGRKIQVGEKIVFKFEEDVDAYMAFSGQPIEVSYDSDHALMSETVTMPSITQRGKSEAALTVPYLFYEDFSGVLKDSESNGDNSYGSDDRNQPGVSLDGVMPVNGWNASRYWVKKDGGSFRVNMRFQMVRIGIGSFGYSFTTSHFGRLDTPPLSGLKSGEEVRLKVYFNAGANVNTGSNDEAESGNQTYINLSTHTNQNNPIAGVGTGTGQDGDLSDFGFTCYTSAAMPNAFGAEDFSNNYPEHTATVDATSTTRLCFYPTTAFAKEGLGVNAEFNVYIDNIKVQIAK